MITVTDFHSHILPGVDDGSVSVEQSLEMLRMEYVQGIRHVVLTPHFYAQHDKPERFLERRAAAVAELREEMARQNDLPEVSIGAEVYYFRGIADSDILSELTIDNNGCILIEMNHAPWSENSYRDLEKIIDKHGLTPIIAHIDRYIGPIRTHGIPDRLARMPVLVQANADFFLHWSTARMALKMLHQEQIHLLGSDCHNASSRAPNLRSALQVIEKKLPPDALAHVHDCERSVLRQSALVNF